MTSFTVGTADVRAALLSVAPHVSPDPEDGVLHRLRLAVEQCGRRGATPCAWACVLAGNLLAWLTGWQVPW